MQIHLLAIGQRMPGWIEEGFETYRKRLPKSAELLLREIPQGKRTTNADLEKIKSEEGQRMLDFIEPQDRVIALEIKGEAWSTEHLALELKKWQETGQRIVLLIGGPEGLSRAARARADLCWSLSPLTLPHPLVRILVAEQIYRAHSILTHHPYHR